MKENPWFDGPAENTPNPRKKWVLQNYIDRITDNSSLNMPSNSEVQEIMYV